MNIKNKKILVTGGAGFIGSHTVDALIGQGAKVVIIDNLITGRKENLNLKAKFYKINIADLALENIFKKEKPEIVYHFAFNVLVPKSVISPLLDMDSIVGSVNLLNNARKYGVKKVIFSSSGFIGNTKKLPIKESEIIQPTSPYAIAKNAVENYLKFFKITYGLPYIILRYATVYGPRQVKGAMADYIRKLYSNKQAEMWGDGNKTRDYIYINDVVRANLLALKLSPNYPDPIFNVGSGTEITLNDVYKKIAKLLGKKAEPIYLPDRAGELIRYCLDCSKIKKTFGWAPKYNLKEGLKLRIKDYVDNL